MTDEDAMMIRQAIWHAGSGAFPIDYGMDSCYYCEQVLELLNKIDLPIGPTWPEPEE